ncbi:MAG: hypothetical protein A3I89_00005 [Candidatus Harrisonbacteria bacterium RIFCSPLOWO2_02_FULL_41_11]|uniref:Uncharacterized protein n=1 Tax=Candidatus Harrisonbacteria bacterium RIFCSPHIGHO2_02_FULL_42_16 TaxID=1798404 RepID=A0A1G1ZFN1_9BACT|nr:MAG: hypothetical protein A3B92_01395 [Candidatus Harrisonbacteria bacterium RIFCSPHIGHO2_02_FULL_42_16]OGY63428.1 MAG: hypothetical protein A3B92_01405 [Candidatus Harrisonbacteria bacterium RIFCSPHIGHO2_02_FULL_42_16]OGY66795.1 MAG: hypothetical protein A3I89_00005 [Candidatus Harrisonbacteria bacterium RIFCSPLOWO2_02_FULL_41_11]
MAIILEEKQQFNWRAFAAVIAIVLFLGAGAYYLFFAPVPGIETIAPSQLKSTKELSGIDFQSDLNRVTSELPPGGKFRNYIGQPSVGITGRTNPFLKY